MKPATKSKRISSEMHGLRLAMREGRREERRVKLELHRAKVMQLLRAQEQAQAMAEIKRRIGGAIEGAIKTAFPLPGPAVISTRLELP